MEKASRKLRYVFSVEDVRNKKYWTVMHDQDFLRLGFGFFFLFRETFFLGFVKQITFKERKYKLEEFWVNS